MQAIGIIVELLSLLIDFQLFKNVTQKDIERNIEQLKERSWFQYYLKNEKYRGLIQDDKDVRHLIGKFNTKKLGRDSSYHEKCHDKLERMLEKKSR